MIRIASFRSTSVLNRSLVLLTSTIRRSTARSTSEKLNDNVEHRDRLTTTKKMRVLGLQSNQARQALVLYEDYVYRQKKIPDLRMFAVAINCAMVAQDLNKGREIHRFIERDFPHLKDNLMLKQQLRYFYMKCNDQQSADRIFQQLSTTSEEQGEIQQNSKVTPHDSIQNTPIEIK